MRERDPVCGMYVESETAVARTIRGKTYYFCSYECADAFELHRGLGSAV